MPTFNSQQLIADLQQQTEDFLQTAVQKFQMLPPQKMLQQPAPGSWSAAQCLEHLNSYGRYYLPALEKSIDTAKQKGLASKETFTSSWIGNYFTELMLPKGKEKTVKKMKAPKEHTPPSQLDSDAVIATFIEQQEKLIQLLEDAKAINLQKAKTPVSISRFIKLPVGDTFRFLLAHNYRHLLQATKALGENFHHKGIIVYT